MSDVCRTVRVQVEEVAIALLDMGICFWTLILGIDASAHLCCISAHCLLTFHQQFKLVLLLTPAKLDTESNCYCKFSHSLIIISNISNIVHIYLCCIHLKRFLVKIDLNLRRNAEFSIIILYVRVMCAEDFFSIHAVVENSCKDILRYFM